MADRYAFPFADCERLDFEPSWVVGAFGDTHRNLFHPYQLSRNSDVAARGGFTYLQVFYRIQNRLHYLHDVRDSICSKRFSLANIFVVLKFFEEIQVLRWKNNPHDGMWRRVYRVGRDRLQEFARHAHRVQTKGCRCEMMYEQKCADFVYPDYVDKLKESVRATRGPFGSEWTVFLKLHRKLGNDLALNVFDWL